MLATLRGEVVGITTAFAASTSATTFAAAAAARRAVAIADVVSVLRRPSAMRQPIAHDVAASPARFLAPIAIAGDGALLAAGGHIDNADGAKERRALVASNVDVGLRLGVVEDLAVSRGRRHFEAANVGARKRRSKSAHRTASERDARCGEETKNLATAEAAAGSVFWSAGAVSAGPVRASKETRTDHGAGDSTQFHSLHSRPLMCAGAG